MSVALVAALGCSTSIERCTARCGEAGDCPSHWSCMSDGWCHPAADDELCPLPEEPGLPADAASADPGDPDPADPDAAEAPDGAAPAPDGGADAVVVEPCQVGISGSFSATSCDCGDSTCTTWIEHVRGLPGGVLRFADGCNPAVDLILSVEVSGSFDAGRCDCGDNTCATHLSSVTGSGNLLQFRNGCNEGADLVLSGAIATGSFDAGQCDCGDSTCRSWTRSVRASGNALVFTNSCGIEGTITFACAP